MLYFNILINKIVLSTNSFIILFYLLYFFIKLKFIKYLFNYIIKAKNYINNIMVIKYSIIYHFLNLLYIIHIIIYTFLII